MSDASSGSLFGHCNKDNASSNHPFESNGRACDTTHDESDDIRKRLEDTSVLGPAEARCRLPMADRSEATEPASQPEPRSPSTDNGDGTRIPFVVQHGRSLFFLTWESSRWTLAELEFDATTCTFVETRRTHYEWPREAFGVLLSRFTLIERVETSLLKRTSDDFARWLGSQFQVVTGTRRDA